MRRKSAQKSSMFKLQAEKNLYKDFLQNLSSCPVVQKHPQYKNILSNVANTIFNYCYCFGEENPFLKGMNYNCKNYGLSFPCIDTLLYKEWICNAKEAYLLGQFNKFNEKSHPLVQNENKMFEIQLDMNEHKIKNEDKIFLNIVDNQGNAFKTAPFLCRIRDDKLENGVVCPQISVPITKSGKKGEKICSYIIDLKEIPIEQCLSYLEKNQQFLKQIDAIILQNLFEDQFVIDKGILSLSKLKIIRQIIDKVKNSFGLKILFEWNFCCGKKKNKNDIIQDAMLKQVSEGHWQYDFSKKDIYSIYLANMFFYTNTLKIDGFFLTSISELRNQCNQVDFEVFIRSLAIMIARLSQNSIIIAQTKQELIGSQQSIFEGGLGFNFTLKKSQNNQSLLKSKSTTEIKKIYENINSSITQINLNHLDKNDDKKGMKMAFAILSCSKGFALKGKIDESTKQILSKTMQMKKDLRNDQKPFRIVSQNNGMMVGKKNNNLFLFNENKGEVAHILEGSQDGLLYQTIAFSGEREPTLSKEVLTMNGPGFVMLQKLE